MCTYCGASGNDVELEIDHIIPVAKGGSNHISNLTTSCMACNRKKGVGVLERKIKNREPNDLIDKPIHLLKDGKIHNQGVIVSVDGDNFIVQRYSFVDGKPTDIIAISKDKLFDMTQCKIYANDEQWHRAYCEELKKEGLLKGTVEENVALSLSQADA